MCKGAPGRAFRYLARDVSIATASSHASSQLRQLSAHTLQCS